METDNCKISVWRLIRSDYRRYLAMEELTPFKVIFASQGFWACCVYRISHCLVTKSKKSILNRLARTFCLFINKYIEIVAGINLSYGSNIGEGFHMPHFGNIFIGATIGRNCTVSQGVTIGYGGHGHRYGRPTLGDRVYVGPNAVIIGRIKIGNDVVIGPGAVVSRSVPDRAVVVGNPASVAWYKGSFDLIRYDGMEDDPERQASFESTKPGIVKEDTPAFGEAS